LVVPSTVKKMPDWTRPTVILYVVDSGSNAVSAFTVSGGSLSELASSPVSLPTGAHPFGIVVD